MIEQEISEKDKRDILTCRMLNAIQIPVNPEVLNVILEVVDLTTNKGETATMKDLDDIVIKYSKQKENKETE